MKQQLKNILVPFLASRPVTAIATRIFGYGIPIFMLHRTDTDVSTSRGHTPELLRQYLQLLKDNGHTFVSLEDVLAAVRGDIDLPPKAVAFTIDDGFQHQARIAAPVFLEYNCPVTIFLITGFLDGELWPWFSQVAHIIENTKTDMIELAVPDNKLEFIITGNESKPRITRSIIETMKLLDDDLVPILIDQLSSTAQVDIPSQPPEKYRPMTWNSARDLEKKGISFGPHTVSHPILSRVNNRKSEHEITYSWKRVNEELTNPVPVFCYPNGRSCDYSAREIESIRKAGLIGAVSTTPKQAELSSYSDLYEYNLPRLSLPDSFQDLIQYSTWIERAKSWS